MVLLGIPGMEDEGPKILMAGGNSPAELLLGRQALEEDVGKQDLLETALDSFLDCC